MKPKVVYRYTMQERGIYQLTDPRTVTNLIPAEFIAFFKTSRSVEDIIDAIARQSREAVIHETLRLERHNLRSERKQPWGTHTRRTFRNVLDNVKPSFREMLRLAEEVAFELGMPYEPKPEGTRGLLHIPWNYRTVSHDRKDLSLMRVFPTSGGLVWPW